MSNLDAALEAMDEKLGLEAAPEEDTPQEEETPEETPVQETETVEETPEEPAAAEEQPERDPAIQAYLDKYGGDPDKAIAAAVEAQKLIGKQGEELGELRKSIESLSERFSEDDDDEYVPPPDNTTVQWLDTLTDENPQAAAAWALQNYGAGPVYDRVMESWYDMSPRQAGQFERALEYRAIQERDAETIRPLQQQAQDQAELQSFNEAWQQLSAEVPDLSPDIANAMLEESQNIPQQMLLGKDVEQKKAVLHTLYRLAKGSAASTLETAKGEAETEQKAANRAAKLSGTTPQTKAVAPEPEMSEGDRWLAQFDWDKHAKRYESTE